MTILPRFGQLPGKLVAAFGGQIGVFLFGFAAQIVLARSLGPEGKGFFTLVITVVNIFFTFIHGSLGSANSHFTGRQPRWAAAIFGNSVTIALVVGGSVVLLFLNFAGGILPQILPKVDLSLVKATIIVLPFLLLLDYSGMIVMGQDRIARFSLILTSREFLFVTTSLLLLILSGLHVQDALQAWVSVAVFISLFACWSAWAGGGFKFQVKPLVWASMAKFSVQAHVANLTTFLKMRADMLIMAYFMSVTDVGYYSIAIAIVAALWYLPASVAQVLIPHISHRDNSAGDILTPRLCRITVFVNIIVGFLIGRFGWIAIKVIFGEQFLPAFPALLILLPGAVLFSLAKLLSGDLGGRGLPRYAMVISTIVMFINIGVNLVLIPLWGIKGAALTASFTHALAGLMFLWAFSHESGVAFKDALIIKRDDFQLLHDAIKGVLAKK